MSPELKALTKDRSCCMTCPNDVNQVLPAPDAFPSPRHVPKFPSPNRMARMWSNGVSWSDGGQPRWTLGWLMRLSSLKPWLSPLSIIIHSSLALKFVLFWACYLVHGLWTNSFSQLSCSRSLDEFVLSVCNAVGVARSREKLVRERGAGSGERGAGISSPNFLEFWRPWRGRPITVDIKCVEFYKILEVASITVVIKWAPKEGSKKGNLLPWMRKDVLHH
jgi:hypothetical protein